MDYKIIYSKRKTLSLSINDDLQIVVRAPYGLNENEINNFVLNNEQWILSALNRKEKQMNRMSVTDEELDSLIKCAKDVIPQRVAYYSSVMNLYPTGVKITKAKKRFGSCSGKNSLCFSCYLMQFPIEAIDYVVVHELAHIKHHNHGKEFYLLIEKFLPDYKDREKMLKC